MKDRYCFYILESNRVRINVQTRASCNDGTVGLVVPASGPVNVGRQRPELMGSVRHPQETANRQVHAPFSLVSERPFGGKAFGLRCASYDTSDSGLGVA